MAFCGSSVDGISVVKTHESETAETSVKGAIYAICAFSFWGILPLYWKQLGGINPREILCHRVLWASVYLVFMVSQTTTIRHAYGQCIKIGRRGIIMHVFAASIITCNWLIYIWAIGQNRVLETSLGYFLSPLVNIILGAVYFREKLSGLQKMAVGLTVLGVGNLVLGAGGLPWISLGLSTTFGVYSLLRKLSKADSLTCLTLETWMMAPFALVYLVYLSTQIDLQFTSGLLTGGLLMGGGLASICPLLFYSSAARRLRLSTLAFFQYISPTLAFVLAVWVFREPFSSTKLTTFGFIWAALALYVINSVQVSRVSRRAS